MMVEQDRLFSTGDPAEPVLDALQRVPGWPYDEPKDRVLVRDLLDSFPQLDLVEEIRSWTAWMLDHDQKKQVNRRARLRRWCSNAVDFGRRPADGPSGRPGSSTPAPPSAFGTETVRLDEW